MRKAIIFPRRLSRFIALQMRFVGDQFQKAFRLEQHRENPSRQIELWKRHLKEMQSLLAQFRLESDPDEVIWRSANILDHRFFLLGLKYEDSIHSNNTASRYASIRWRRDPGSGYEWSRNDWYRNSRRNVSRGADIKAVWELSRCQHFLLLGEAYVLTQDERYVLEYRNQILDWIEANPVRYGPNWAVTMEVGIRIANWLVALLYFVNSRELSSEFYARLLTSIEQHGKHITSNLENISLITSNHTLGNIAGLYMLSVLCPVLESSQKWRSFAGRELEKEIFKQTFEDGWDFESSTAYHRLVTEMFLYPFLTGDWLREPFPQDYADRLRKMIGVLAGTAKPNGRIPQIGDNDNGRFLVFRADRNIEDLRIDYLLQTAQRNPRIAVKVRSTESFFYLQAGRYLFRNRRIYLLVSAGPKGQAGGGGHAHNDVLGFELNLDGQDIIVDPGTYCYTTDPKTRNHFRSVANHNTLSWKGLEPCSLDKGLFVLPEQGLLRIEKYDLGTNEDVFSAIYAYKGRFHRREVVMKKAEDEIEIKDSCSHEGAQLSFVCAPKIHPIVKDETFQADKAVFRFEGAKEIEVESSYCSPSYGKRMPTRIVRIHLSGKTISYTIGFRE